MLGQGVQARFGRLRKQENSKTIFLKARAQAAPASTSLYFLFLKIGIIFGYFFSFFKRPSKPFQGVFLNNVSTFLLLSSSSASWNLEIFWHFFKSWLQQSAVVVGKQVIQRKLLNA